MKQCRNCHQQKPESEFYAYRSKASGVVNIKPDCKKCLVVLQYAREKLNPERLAARRRVIYNRASEQRRTGVNTAHWIYIDAKSSDRKRGFDNDLTRVFIEQTVENGCCYCGATTLRMTLDRIDNSTGHLRSNVVPACIRCNYMRRDMPYEAWLVITPAVRRAHERGLFGDWTGRIIKHRSK